MYMKRLSDFFRRHDRILWIIYLGWSLLQVMTLIYIRNTPHR